MRTLLYPLKETWDALCKRPVMDTSGFESEVKSIIGRVKSEGDKALFDYSEKFDHVTITGLKVTGTELDEAEKQVTQELKNAIRIAMKNIEKFHESQMVDEELVETTTGVKCWRKWVPVERPGLYIPGGTAPLFSTVLMLGIPARIAG